MEDSRLVGNVHVEVLLARVVVKRTTRYVLLAVEVTFLADALQSRDDDRRTKSWQCGRVVLVPVRRRDVRLQFH